MEKSQQSWQWPVVTKNENELAFTQEVEQVKS
jgi:hypothetical protein